MMILNKCITSKSKKIRNFIVIGSSRGLGAAIVNELIKNESFNIIGISRTDFEELPDFEEWKALNRYEHIKLDITSQNCVEVLSALNSKFPEEAFCVMFNAAFIKSDVNNNNINYDIFNEINSVGITGFKNVLESFVSHLLNYGGIFVGISSYSAFIPPVFTPKVAYPATKAYLDMALRSLRLIWKDKVAVVTVHLGHMRESAEGVVFPKITLTYSKAAKKIVSSITAPKVAEEINIPFLYNIVYRYFLRYIPDRVNLLIFNLFCKGQKNET